MTTRLTDQVLANVHSDMAACVELDPLNNQFMAEVLNDMDQITVDGYDADAAAASLFAFASVLRNALLAASAEATVGDIVRYLATMATLTGQAMHAQTHAVAQEPTNGAAVTVERVHAALALAARWPPDRRETLPAVVAGQAPEPYMLEALRQYRAARGLSPLLNVITLTAAHVNEAVTWWNHRAAMLNLENPR